METVLESYEHRKENSLHQGAGEADSGSDGFDL